MTTENISVNDWGLSMGYGLFETLRLYNGLPYLLELHLQRLHLSAKTLFFTHVPSLQVLEHNLMVYIHQHNLQDHAVRMSLTYGGANTVADAINSAPVCVRGSGAGQGKLFFTHREVVYSPNDYTEGIHVVFSEYRKNEFSPIVRHKTFNQLENILPLRLLNRPDIKEIIFLNTSGYLSEGSKSNLFFVRDGVIYTPSVECGLLPGITRTQVIRLAKQLKIEILEGQFLPRFLLNCDECFCTNTLMEIMPINSINNKPMPSAVFPGQITSALASAYKKAITDQDFKHE